MISNADLGMIGLLFRFILLLRALKDGISFVDLFGFKLGLLYLFDAHLFKFIPVKNVFRFYHYFVLENDLLALFNILCNLWFDIDSIHKLVAWLWANQIGLDILIVRTFIFLLLSRHCLILRFSNTLDVIPRLLLFLKLKHKLILVDGI